MNKQIIEIKDKNHPYQTNKQKSDLGLLFWNTLSVVGKFAFPAILFAINFLCLIVVPAEIGSNTIIIISICIHIITAILALVFMYQVEVEKEKLGFGSNFFQGKAPEGFLAIPCILFIPAFVFMLHGISMYRKNAYLYKKRYFYKNGTYENIFLESNPGFMIKLVAKIYFKVKPGSEMETQLSELIKEPNNKEKILQ